MGSRRRLLSRFHDKINPSAKTQTHIYKTTHTPTHSPHPVPPKPTHLQMSRARVFRSLILMHVTSSSTQRRMVHWPPSMIDGSLACKAAARPWSPVWLSIDST